MDPVRLAFIANGAMGDQCLNMALGDTRIKVAALGVDNRLANSQLLRTASRENIPIFELSSLQDEIENLRKLHINYLLNVNSRVILGKEILELPTHGSLNFHNSFLPDYRGLNVCSWAIYNGEEEYGVTWHFIDADKGIDAGANVLQRRFPLCGNETAYSLIVRCVEVGIHMFPELIDLLVANVTPSPVTVRPSSRLFLGREIPNNGKVPIGGEFEIAYRFLRAMDFRPLKTELIPAFVEIEGELFDVVSYRGLRDPEMKQVDHVVTLERCRSGIHFIGGTIQLPRLRKQSTGELLALTDIGEVADR